MFCDKCGQELLDDALFCFRCGTKQIQVQSGSVQADSESQTASAGQYTAPQTTAANTGSVENNGAAVQYTTTGQSAPAQNMPDKVLVNLRKGHGLTVFSLNPLPGDLAVSENGVSYTGKITNSNDHAYSYDQIQTAELKITRVGVQPVLGYRVFLKNGTEYVYVCSPILKFKIDAIDKVVQSRIVM